MKNNELRLGNLVFRKYWNPQPGNERFCLEPCIVTFISGNNVNVSPINKNVKLKFKIGSGDISPIELTGEWFLRLGFKEGSDIFCERIEYDFFFGEGKYVSVSDTNEIYMGCFSQTLQYVHQLQNLIFATSGVELQLSST